MTARMRRLASDWEQLKQEFAGHRYISVVPAEGDPPERYRVTYLVNGIYLLPDGTVSPIGRHEVEITLHAEYPRYKPICRIFTPIWHPNFRDGQICIGDIWGAGESLSDIIINIGDMIQYKSWNSYSPLSADAARWAIENKHLFPVGNIELRKADFTGSKKNVEIELFDEPADTGAIEEPPAQGGVVEGNEPSGQSAVQGAAWPVRESGIPAANEPPVIKDIQSEAPIPPAEGEAGAAQDNSAPVVPENETPFIPYDQAAAEQPPPAPPADQNDFDITAEELAGIVFVPSAQRMQNLQVSLAGKKKVNFKTILVKGLLWALIGALLGFGVTELLTGHTSDTAMLRLHGYNDIAEYSEISHDIDQMERDFSEKYKDIDYDNLYSLDQSTQDAMLSDYYEIESRRSDLISQYIVLVDKYGDTARYGTALQTSDVQGLTDSTDKVIMPIMENAIRLSSGCWSALLALFLGLLLGIGEGVYYGSKSKTAKYAFIGMGVSIVLGFVSGYLAQWLYSQLLSSNASEFMNALVRGAGWSVMGLGVGLAIGLIKPGTRRIIFCIIGGMLGAFIGGFIFNFITVDLSDTGVLSRGIGIAIMGLLVGLGIGLLEQFAKVAWLKVTRGEFEGKEYLVFTGTTSIGNSGKNTIVLFKDKLVGPHHCDIVLEGGRYVLIDQGTPMGTIVNGMRISRHILKKGDAVAIGNSVLVFNTK